MKVKENLTMNNPTISVIIPTYNREKYILRAVNSVLNQGFKDFELIIVDDASEDDTQTVIKNISDHRVIYHQLKENRGGSGARNFGIEIARGKYIAFLDSDDEFFPELLDKYISIVETVTEKTEVIYCYPIVYVEGKSDGTYFCDPPFIRGDVYHELLKGWCPNSTSLFFVKSEVFKTIGLFDENLASLEDFDLWIRISEKYQFEVLPEHLVKKHEHGGFQLGKSMEPRIDGLNHFFAKWKETIKKEIGVNHYNKLYRENMETACEFALNDFPLRKNIDGLTLISILLRAKSKRIKLYIKACILTVFGRNTLGALLKIKQS